MTDIGELFLGIDGPLLREQRERLLNIISRLSKLAIYKEYSSARFAGIRLRPADLEALEGIQNLLDGIADIAHDQFGKECLLTEGDEDA